MQAIMVQAWGMQSCGARVHCLGRQPPAASAQRCTNGGGQPHPRTMLHNYMPGNSRRWAPTCRYTQHVAGRWLVTCACLQSTGSWLGYTAVTRQGAARIALVRAGLPLPCLAAREGPPSTRACMEGKGTDPIWPRLLPRLAMYKRQQRREKRSARCATTRAVQGKGALGARMQQQPSKEPSNLVRPRQRRRGWLPQAISTNHKHRWNLCPVTTLCPATTPIVRLRCSRLGFRLVKAAAQQSR